MSKQKREKTVTPAAEKYLPAIHTPADLRALPALSNKPSPIRRKVKCVSAPQRGSVRPFWQESRRG